MLLARYAENAFWLGRYMERIESLSRLLMVTESFAADQDSDDAWAPILNVFADTGDFTKRGKPLTALNVANFYLSDTENPNSIFLRRAYGEGKRPFFAAYSFHGKLAEYFGFSQQHHNAATAPLRPLQTFRNLHEHSRELFYLSRRHGIDQLSR